MPFTAAHTVAVLPFVRSRRLSGTALVAGSMSPDFEYFIRIDTVGIWGHDFRGIFLFDLPMTLLLCWLFHRVVKNNFIDNLPPFLQRKYAHLKEFTFKDDVIKRPFAFVVCACLGALTHVLWDGFTHEGGYFVKWLPGLYEARFVQYGHVNYPLWYALQYISTIVGMAILISYLVFTRSREATVVKPNVVYWIALIMIAVMVMICRLQFKHGHGEDIYIISAISGLLYGVILLGLLPGKMKIAVN
jgi:hypothetical protein